jgi:SAM-dependent methyltransferase
MRALRSISALASQTSAWRDRRFDARFGLDTCSAREELVDEFVHRRTAGNALHYEATSAALFRRIIRHSRANPQEFTFVDLGAGKGRLLLLAAEAGFASVVGVEIDPGLCRVAVANIERWSAGRSSRAPEIIEGDARDMRYPLGDLFVFLFNPFTGPLFELVAERLARLAREPQRRVIIVYHHDVCSSELERTGAFKRVRVRPMRFWTHSTLSLFYNEEAWRRHGRGAANR